MASVERIEQLLTKMKARLNKAKQDHGAAVVVGYTQAYAIYVHENLQAHHPVGQAKFLEQPARELQPVLRRIISEAASRGQTLEQSLLLAGLRLQRESQKLCPVDTGALKASAFTRKESS
jgi:predicted GNAT family N-acyltransferase